MAPKLTDDAISDFFWWMSVGSCQPPDKHPSPSQKNCPQKKLKKLILHITLATTARHPIPQHKPFFHCDPQGNITYEEKKLTPQLLRDLLKTLHPYYRCQLILLYIIKMPYNHICQLMNIPRGNIMAGMHYARRTLVPQLKQWDLPTNDLLIECGAIIDGGLTIPDQKTYTRILEEDKRLQPYMQAVKNLKHIIHTQTKNTPTNPETHCHS